MGFADEMSKLSRLVRTMKVLSPVQARRAQGAGQQFTRVRKTGFKPRSRPAQGKSLAANVTLGTGLLGAGAYSADKVFSKPLRRMEIAARRRTGPLGQQSHMQPARSWG
jgi:hypothetical protein